MIALALMLAQAASPAPFISGEGLSTCRNGYERARSNPLYSQVLVDWEIGFWAGLNYANSATVGAAAIKSNMVAIETETARECASHPDDAIYQAEIRAYQRLKMAGL